MRTSIVTTVMIVAAAAALAAGTAYAGPVTCNTCTGNVDSPFQGGHIAMDNSISGVLWPPNHKFRTITISAENSNGNACNVTITDVRQDEPVKEAASGSGSTSPDAANCSNTGNDSRVDLRGERSGSGDARFYHVMYNMDDPDCPMMPSMADAKIVVPHDQGIAHLDMWVDEGPLFRSSGDNTTPFPCAQ